MTTTKSRPSGIPPTDGIVHRASPFTFDDTVGRLTQLIGDAGAELFGSIDQSAAALRAGQSLRPTRLLIFGNPAAGTPLMAAAPQIAIELPLKLLVWADDDGDVWISYLTGEWLAERYGIATEHAGPLSATAALASRLLEKAP